MVIIIFLHAFIASSIVIRADSPPALSPLEPQVCKQEDPHRPRAPLAGCVKSQAKLSSQGGEDEDSGENRAWG